MKKLSFYDFDGTLMNSPEKEWGKNYWKEKTGEEYPHLGWWGRPESLSTEVFDIKPFDSLLKLLRRDYSDSDTYVVILTNRMKKLEPQLEKILKINNIQVDELNTKIGNKRKDQRILEYLEKFPNVEQIDVYDDMEDQITTLKGLAQVLPENIEYNIYKADNGSITKMEIERSLEEIIITEIQNFIKN